MHQFNFVILLMIALVGCSHPAQRQRMAPSPGEELIYSEITRAFTDGDLSKVIRRDDLKEMDIVGIYGRTPTTLDAWIAPVVFGKNETRFVLLRKNGVGSSIMVEEDFPMPPREQAIDLAIASLNAAPPEFWGSQEPTLEQFRNAEIFYTIKGRRIGVHARSDGCWGFLLGGNGEILFDQATLTQ